MNLRFLKTIAAPVALLAAASMASGQFAQDKFAQDNGCSLYSCSDFPGDQWPTDPVPATSVSIGNPTGITVDPKGNVYIAGPSIVFKLDPSGKLTRIAGNGHNGYSGDGGQARDALLGFPSAVPNDPIDFWDVAGSLASDASGNLYIADFFNSRVRKIASDGVISTVAGEGFAKPFGWTAGVAWMPTRGPRETRRPQDSSTYRPTVGAAGDLYAVGSYDTVWKVDSGGSTRILDNNCGHPEKLGVCVPYGLATDRNGNVYVADSGNSRVLQRSSDGDITVVVGRFCAAHCGSSSGDGGPAASATLSEPYGLAVDAAGNLFIVDTYSNRIRKVSPDGIITTVAGRGPAYGYQYKGGYSGDGGPAIDAELNLPHAVAVDAAGNIYIADTENFRIRKVSVQGIITTVAGNGSWCCAGQ